MRISDWSSDLCSSDLLLVERFDRLDGERLRLEDFAQVLGKPRGPQFGGKYGSSYEEAASVIVRHSARARLDLARFYKLVIFNFALGNADAHLRSEEHTSELQSLMRISYAVFCLKKNNTQNTT